MSRVVDQLGSESNVHIEPSSCPRRNVNTGNEGSLDQILSDFLAAFVHAECPEAKLQLKGCRASLL